MKFRDYDNYEIYEDGRIWSYKSKKFLKPKTDKGGYQQVFLYDNNGKAKCYLLHRVVWEAVTGEPIPEGYEINHISEDKTENFFSNLELVTHKYNINFGTRNERAAKAISKANSNNKKLSKAKSKQVGAFKNGKLVLVFSSTKEAGRNGFVQGNISYCCIGKRKTHRGYEWRYL